jgi:hypothetical protein
MKHSHSWEATYVDRQPAMICTQRGCLWLWYPRLDVKTTNTPLKELTHAGPQATTH